MLTAPCLKHRSPAGGGGPMSGTGYCLLKGIRAVLRMDVGFLRFLLLWSFLLAKCAGFMSCGLLRNMIVPHLLHTPIPGDSYVVPFFG